MRQLRRAAVVLLALAACQRSTPGTPAADATVDDHRGRLPTGARLDPDGADFEVGPLPLAMRMAPGGRRAVLLLSGWRLQGVQVIEPATRRVTQTLPQRAAFVGLAWAPDSQTLYASGGNTDVVYRYAWAGDSLALRDSIVLAVKRRPADAGTRYPAGLALSRDGRSLYVAENLADSLAVVDVARGVVTQRLPMERYPYDVVVAPDGAVYASAWGGSTVSVFRADSSGTLAAAPRIRAGRHPSALLLDPTGTRLFVASASTDRVVVVDTRRGRVLTELLDPPGARGAARRPAEGSTPSALALSGDGLRLYVAESDANAVAVFDLSPMTSGRGTGPGTDSLAGRIPVGWYPSALLARGDTLLVANGKGHGTRANPGGPQPGVSREHIGPATPDTTYTLGQISGSLSVVAAGARGEMLDALTARVERANGWSGTGDSGLGTRERTAESPVPNPQSRFYPPITHVVYIIKENRTYDQIFGDFTQADGDTSLLFFPRDVTPNHHALAERFGIFDRFFVNAEVSPDGHNWSTAAYTTDYLQKTVPSNYSGRGRSYDYEGTNRNEREAARDDAAEPANGYLWNLVQRRGLSFRNYGEFVRPEGADEDDPLPAGYRGVKPFLEANTNRDFPGFDMNVPDQRRADVWLADLAEFARRGAMPALQIIRLPNDHTSGARAGSPTPRAYLADNDLALGRIVEALSRSPFWRSTAVFVLEDDAQNGPDHVDSHRSPLLVISPWARGGVTHRFANTTDVLRTIEEILGLDAMSQFDWYGRPLRDIWRATPDLAPYTVLRPSVALDEKNPSRGRGARESRRLDLAIEDVAEEELFNRILWRAIKGDSVPYPGARRMGGAELKNLGTRD